MAKYYKITYRKLGDEESPGNTFVEYFTEEKLKIVLKGLNLKSIEEYAYKNQNVISYQEITETNWKENRCYDNRDSIFNFKFKF